MLESYRGRKRDDGESDCKLESRIHAQIDGPWKQLWPQFKAGRPRRLKTLLQVTLLHHAVQMSIESDQISANALTEILWYRCPHFLEGTIVASVHRAL